MIDHDLTHLSLCSGIGGLDLALETALGSRPVAYCERDAYAQAVLLARMEAKDLGRAPLFEDLHELDGRIFSGCVDVLAAGFPCQAFSTATRGRSVADDLTDEVLRVVDESRPTWVLLENVQGTPILGAATGLRSLGYSSWRLINCASQVGAPHRRVRHWLLAVSHNPMQPAVPLHEEVARLREAALPDGWSEAPDGFLGVDDGLPAGVDRSDVMRVIGNSVCPQQAMHAIRGFFEG